jgi:hypothetical protein
VSPYFRPAGLLRASRKRAISLTATTVAVGVIVTGVVVSGAPQRVSAAVTGTDIYVSNASSANCSDTGSGSEATPFCTISAAAAVAQAGQTVIVEPGTYAPVTISVSGAPGNPVTFQGATTGVASIEPATKADAVLISGAHDVVISGFRVYPFGAPGYEVTGSSSDITINGTDTTGTVAAPDIEVDAASNVTISRSSLAAGTNVRVNSGASGVVITGNTLISNGRYPAVAVTGAPGTDVTGNTLYAQCGPAIDVSGASAGASIENNVVSSYVTAPSSTCTNADGTTAIAVSADSTPGTTSDYNLINPAPFTALYDWGGTSYPDLGTFQGATAQGMHDIAANPQLGTQEDTSTVTRGAAIWYPLTDASPAIDSANADAPGELAADQLGNPRSDDPGIGNTGTGSGTGTSTTYFDRGAAEVEGGVHWGGQSVSDSGPLTVTAHQQATPVWATNGPLYFYSYSIDGGAVAFTGASSIQHTFQLAGTHGITMGTYQGGSNYAIQGVRSYDAVVGADYTPVTPARVLDTRDGTGVAMAGAVAANGTVTLSIPATGGVPAADISAVVMNVTVTQPKAAGVLTVYPGTGTPPTTSNLNFSAGETVPNLVTAQLSDGKVSFRNTSKGTVQVIADLNGFYGPGGYGFQPQSPARVLDTRNGTGTAKRPLAPASRIQLNLSGKVPAGTAAVVMNVTVTGPQKAGYLRVYPDSPTVPGISNLNFSAGETVPNLVIVPLAGGITDIYNSSPGTVQVIADLAGYFAAGAPDSFVPYGPIRTDDTRGTSFGPLKPSATYNVGSAYPDLVDANGSCFAPACPPPAAIVTNITVTQPTRAGYLSVYPGGSARPATSTLNFSAGQTVPNLVIMQTKPGAEFLVAYNASPGTLQLVADEYGYFIPAAG